MTLQEVVKSGKKFKRKGMNYFVFVHEQDGRMYTEESDMYIDWIINREDILAEDWEVEEIKLSFTFNEIMLALESIGVNKQQKRVLEIALGYRKHTSLSKELDNIAKEVIKTVVYQNDSSRY